MTVCHTSGLGFGRGCSMRVPRKFYQSAPSPLDPDRASEEHAEVVTPQRPVKSRSVTGGGTVVPGLARMTICHRARLGFRWRSYCAQALRQLAHWAYGHAKIDSVDCHACSRIPCALAHWPRLIRACHPRLVRTRLSPVSRPCSHTARADICDLCLYKILSTDDPTRIRLRARPDAVRPQQRPAHTARPSRSHATLARTRPSQPYAHPSPSPARAPAMTRLPRTRTCFRSLAV